MKHNLALLALSGALILSGPAHAADCYADYKAKQDSPLRLHYGVIHLTGPCNKGAAGSEVASRLSGSGWRLLNVVSVFGPDGLEKRRPNAGSYYLRF